MAIVALCTMACSEKDDPETAADLAGTYVGYTNASCAYFKDRYTDNETVKVTANEDGTLKVVFESASWGTFNVDKAKFSKEGKTFKFTGSGKVSMGMGKTTKEYDFTMTGTTDAEKKAYAIAYSIPAVMGGLTVTLLPGSAPAAAE